MRARLFLGILIAAIGMISLGCAEKLTYERWQTIHDGATADVVEAALGKPWQTTEQTWVYYDQDKAVTVMVYFDKNQVIGTTWQSPEHGMKGKSPSVNRPGDSEQIKAQSIK